MIERRKTRYEMARRDDARAGCSLLSTGALFGFLIGFLMGWVANG